MKALFGKERHAQWRMNSAAAAAAALPTDIEIARGVHQQSDVIELLEAGEYALLQMRLLLIGKCDGLDSAERRVHKGTDQQAEPPIACRMLLLPLHSDPIDALTSP